MKQNEMDFLDTLLDDEIKIICDNTDLDILLEPIKKNNKTYLKYRKKLGMLNKKSITVQKYMYPIAYELYKKGDFLYKQIMLASSQILKDAFKIEFNEFNKNDLGIEIMNKFTIDDYKKFLIDRLLKKNNYVDLDLFWLQIKLNDIKITKSMKIKVSKEWEHINEIANINREWQKKVSDIELEKEKEIKEKINQQELLNNKKLEEKNDAILEQKNSIENNKNIIYEQSCKIDNLNKDIIKKDKIIKDKSNENSKLLCQINSIKKENNDVNDELYEKKSNLYEIVEKEWKEKNKKIEKQHNDLFKRIEDLNKEVYRLENKKNTLKEQISKWDLSVNKYLENLDEKILNHKINSLLFKDTLKVSDNNKTNENNNDDFYVIEGYTPGGQKKCDDYEEYIEIVEANLSNMGVKDFSIYDSFNAAINSGIMPLICGFSARNIAKGLITSRFGEIPSIISIPSGYTNTSNLQKKISSVRTNTVIVEDAFGKMNESLILPILRSHDKIIVFTSESIEDLQYLPKYYYNYLYLIAINDYTMIKTEYTYCSDADYLFTKKVFENTSNGNKIARKILNPINMDKSYIVTRGQILSSLMNYEIRESDKDSMLNLLNSELKWLISEEQKEQLIDIFENNFSDFSNELCKCFGVKPCTVN